jgi:hypothetical protein
MRNGLDEALGPEASTDAEIVAPKVYRRLRLGRLRMACAQQFA